MYLKVHRFVFLGELPERLAGVRESSGSMAVAMLGLTGVCMLMGLLVLVPALRVGILDPAVSVLTDGLAYSARLISP
jgi:hypothetical protein